MEPRIVTEHTRIVPADSLATAVREGLSASPKSLPSKYLYDEVGSQLFEAICCLAEYDLTRNETLILTDHAPEMVRHVGPDCRLVELGAGSAIKTRILIRAMLDHHQPLVYCPIDISEEAMRIAQANIVSEFPDCTFKGIIGDWIGSLARLRQMDRTQKLILFLGSSIGNLDEPQAIGLLGQIKEHMGPDDKLLLGTDLVKPASELVPAYDDPAGVTAAFDMNLLVRINRELGADFDTRRFEHEARWNAEKSRIEMHLVSEVDQTVEIPALGMQVVFKAGESIHTESSHKYTEAMVHRIVEGAGLDIERTWTDPARRFALHLIRPGG